jgi:hypothetical protein
MLLHRFECVPSPHYPLLYLGMSSGQAGPAKSLTQKTAAQARPDPDYRATFSYLGPARRAKISSGCRVGPFLNLLNLLPRPGLTCQSGQISLPRPSPSGQNKRSGQAIFRPGWAAHAQVYLLPCCARRHIPLVRLLPHLFLWDAIIPTLLLPVDADIHALVMCQPPLHPGAHNTVILALLWTIWKSRNMMTFDSNTLSSHTSSLC